MEWNILTAQNLAIIEREVSNQSFSPSEYEIVRRVIYATADFDYQSIISFLDQPLDSGTAALGARVPVLVDSATIQGGITNLLQNTFLNPVYCLDDISLPSGLSAKKSQIWQTVARRYPSAMYIIGENALLLLSLLGLIEGQQIKPSLIIATPAGFLKKQMIINRLRNSSIPQIRIDSSKGGVGSAIAIFEGLVDLAWIARNQKI
jgi:precorrin-8X/cobalt-precorrin-8 methylmutase